MDISAGTFIGRKRSILAFCLTIWAVLSLLVHFVVKLDKNMQRSYLQEHVLAQASDLRTRLEHEINTTLNLTLGSLVYVASHPNISQDEFALFAKEIIHRAPYIQNMGLAKDNVISHIYPLQNNEKALGLRYLDNSAQRDAVVRAIETRKTVIAGPVNLVQGGQGFISRIPIFLNDGNNSYWGISSIVVKVEAFFNKVGLTEIATSMNIALRGKDASGASGEVFYGDKSLFDNPANVILMIPLPQGNWVLAAAPKQGWIFNNSRVYKMYTVGISISLLIAVLLYFLMLQNIALKREQLKAIQASEHKSRFFTNMTHELRTPLTAIFGAIRLLASNKVPVNSVAWQELFNNAERNCQRLMWLVNDVLDLKKLESGKLKYHLTLESMDDVVKDAMDEVQQYAEQFHINIVFNDHPQQLVKVKIDRKRIQQVIVNLLSNAIKFSPANAQVEITVQQKDDCLFVEVLDYGNGIDENNIEGIFSEFDQAEQTSESSRKIAASTGLGLSISKKLVEDHGGSIGCYNKENAGAVFFFKLPLPQDDLHQVKLP